MLCPELWNFPTPAYTTARIDSTAGWTNVKRTAEIRREIGAQPLNRTVSIVIPANEPQCLSALEEDLAVGSCTLYRVRQLPVVQLLAKPFVEAFVKRVSLNASLETSDSASITADGILTMSLLRESYERLEGAVSSSARSRKGDKHVVRLDLKSPDVRDQITNAPLAFDMLLRWIPPGNEGGTFDADVNACVSACSIEKYLHTRCQQVELVPDGCQKVIRHDESIPLLPPAPNGGDGDDDDRVYCTRDELLEYVGLLVLDCNTDETEYVNSYAVEGCQRPTETLSILHRRGLITADEIERCIGRLVELVTEQAGSSALPWMALHVQGFPNVPLLVPGRQRECGVYWNHDSAYTAIITGEGRVHWSKVFGRRT
uniref:Uncharacterized protein n=1 Tax=Anopheles dirus TaxID=7168 RepID=A0A182N0N2_9DIPT